MTSQPGVEIREADWIDLILLVPRLRKADVTECEALFGKGSVSKIASDTFTHSTMRFAVVVDKVVIALFGMTVHSMLGGVGHPWMFGSVAIEKHLRRALDEDGPLYISDMLRLCPRLENVVDSRNLKSIRWLQRMGFTVKPAVPMGVAGTPFHPFVMEV